MRHELKARNIKKLKVIYSKEIPIKPLEIESISGQVNKLPSTERDEKTLIRSPYRRQTPGSVAFVPSVAGLIIAGEVIKDIAESINDL